MSLHQVLVITLVASLVCKDVDMDDDGVDEDEERALIADEDEWYRPSRKGAQGGFYPIDEDSLDRVRKARMTEIAIWYKEHRFLKINCF